MQELLTLTQTEFTLLAVICFCAGLVRGFTGFALSAIVMASAALILSPLALIPICWWLELVASAMMVRGGWKDADKGAAVTLWLGSAVAVPIGLYFHAKRFCRTVPNCGPVPDTGAGGDTIGQHAFGLLEHARGIG